ncbi:MAG: hypothetical protein K2X66_05290 [Cyanobacteria bacterium]|nr:hypothetical protein [Cyanobacteriota bacterium]
MSSSRLLKERDYAYTYESEVLSSVYNASRHSFTDSYLHGKRVQSKFKKHAVKLKYLYYSLIAVAVVFGLFQATRTIISGTYAVTVLSSKQASVENYYQSALAENQLLKDRISVYSAPAGIEELARNNLEMVGADEILVRTH